jgi:DNA-binding NarL/FixJ family response regulator
MKILIADDHAVFRRGLKETLSEAFSKIVFGEARTAHETLELAQRQDWDVIILDISMPGKSGLDILDDLRRLRPRIPVLLLTMHPEQQFARRALKGGAAGYLTKDSVPDEMKEAIKRIVSGGRYVSATLAETLPSSVRSIEFWRAPITI